MDSITWYSTKFCYQQDIGCNQVRYKTFVFNSIGVCLEWFGFYLIENDYC